MESMSDFTLYLLVLLVVAVAITIGAYRVGYQTGQIDALTGKVYYCLEKQASYELTWQYHSEGCKAER